MPPFTALATKVYKDPLTVQWMNSIQANDNYMFTGTIKAWCIFDGTTSTMTAEAAHNVTNIIDTGVGEYTIVFTTAFATTAYTIAGSSRGGNASIGGFVCESDTGTKAPGQIEIRVIRNDSQLRDFTAVSVWAIGVLTA